MTIRRHCGLAALTCALAACGFDSAIAAESGAYVGFGFGNSHIDLGDTSASIGLPASFPTDESDSSWNLALGYRFSPYVGVEASYLDLGEATLTLNRSFLYSGFTFTNIDAAATVQGTTLAVVGAIPAGNWEFFGRLGVFFAKTELSGRIRGRTNSSPTQLLDSPFDDSATTTETLAALGLGYTIADHYHLRVEWLRSPKVGDEEETGEGDVTSLSLGFQYRF